ncbi:MAG: MaoC/PaaZ C-terminal domain-containing protein [Martelella sp.]|jgi:acyl dehydratase|uniref:MaoC/PaaZ C-terminal domain-containing protein n=1 Tax=Martelella sp. TaxID=1969699 RepID=UPI0032423908
MTEALAVARVGDALPELRFGPITRDRLARFAKASGDHNPIHLDSDFARAAGADEVFGHGMLTMGVLTRLVSGWCGQASLRQLDLRFLAKTPLGATLACTGTVTARRDDADGIRLTLAIAAALEDGTTVLAGTALVALPQPGENA